MDNFNIIIINQSYQELYSLYRSPDIVRGNKCNRFSWTRHVVRSRIAFKKIDRENLQEKGIDERLGIDGRKIIEWVFKK